MTNEMNIDNLRIFVEGLNDVPDWVKNNQVNMTSTHEPVCGTVGCHAGLISIVGNYIPKLQSLYFDDCNYDDYKYDYLRWADTLAQFLGFDNSGQLRNWTYDNPDLWGNPYGYALFDDGSAFGEETDIFNHSVIINYWSAVLKRVEELNKKGEI